MQVITLQTGSKSIIKIKDYTMFYSSSKNLELIRIPHRGFNMGVS